MNILTFVVAVCAGLVCGHASPAPAVEGSSSCVAKVTAFPFEPNSECCKFVGKGNHAIYQHPWTALIYYEIEVKKAKKNRALCGGTLISGRYVLTSAVCISEKLLKEAKPLAVRFGEYNSSHAGRDCVPADGGGEYCNNGNTHIGIETMTPHPMYSSSSRYSFDIGLIRLREAAPYTDFIRPICLPTKNLESNPPDHPLYAVTWYYPQKIRRKLKTVIKAPFVDHEKCQQIYSTPSRKTMLSEGQICAGGTEGMDTCKGDAGSPLVYVNEGRSELIGIVSFGLKKCGQKDIPAIYTNVYQYLDWIKSVIVA